MTKEMIFNIVYYAIYGIIGIISIVIAIKQRAKQKNVSNLQALYECIPNVVVMAEELFGQGNGKNKKEFVMTKLINIALESKTKYDFADLDKRVEDVVKATKQVNVKVDEKISDSAEETFQDTVETKSEQLQNFVVVGDYANVQTHSENTEKVGE